MLRIADLELVWGRSHAFGQFSLGGAIYTMPSILATAGVTKALTLLCVSGCLTLVVYEYLARAAVQTQKGSLSRIVDAVLGPAVAGVLRILVVLNAMGVVAAYLATVFDVKEAAGGAAAMSGFPGQCFLSIVAGGLIASGTLEARFSHIMDWGSLIANAALLVLIFALIYLATLQTPVKHSASGEPVLSWWRAAVDMGPSLVFAFSSAEYVLRACDVADDDGVLTPGIDAAVIKKRVRLIGLISVVISGTLYFFTGIAGVAAFGREHVQQDILSNLKPPCLLFATVLGVNAVSLVLSFPVFVEALLLYLRELFEAVLPQKIAHTFNGSQWMNPSKPMLASVWVVPFAWAFLQFTPGLRQIINLVSSATDYYFMFVFPPLVHLFCSPLTDSWLSLALGLVAVLLTVSAALMGAMSFQATFSEAMGYT